MAFFMISSYLTGALSSIADCVSRAFFVFSFSSCTYKGAVEDLFILPNLLSLGVRSSTVSKLVLDALLWVKDDFEVLL